MSNTNVGPVYQQIISDVVDASRVDFEEGGVDEHVLEELRLVRILLFFTGSSLFQSNAIIVFIFSSLEILRWGHFLILCCCIVVLDRVLCLSFGSEQ